MLHPQYFHSKLILNGKFLLIFNWDNHFKLCIKKKKKQPIEENCAWNSEFCSPNLTKQKKEV